MLRYFDFCDVFMTSSMSKFYVTPKLLQFLAPARVLQCVEIRFSPRTCILLESANLQCLICYQLSKSSKKYQFQCQVCLQWLTFSLTCSTCPNILKYYQQVRFLKRNELAKFREDIIFVDRALTSQIIRHTSKFDDLISFVRSDRHFAEFLTLL